MFQTVLATLGHFALGTTAPNTNTPGTTAPGTTAEKKQRTRYRAKTLAQMKSLFHECNVQKVKVKKADRVKNAKPEQPKELQQVKEPEQPKELQQKKKGRLTFANRRKLLSKNAPTGGTHNPTKRSNKRKRSEEPKQVRSSEKRKQSNDSEEPKQKKTKTDCKVDSGFKRAAKLFLASMVSKKEISGISVKMWNALSAEDHKAARWDSLLQVQAGRDTSRMHELYRKVTTGESPAAPDGALSVQTDASVAAVREPSPPPALEPTPTRPTTGGKSMERVAECQQEVGLETESDSNNGNTTESESRVSSPPGSPQLNPYHNPERVTDMGAASPLSRTPGRTPSPELSDAD